MSGGLLIISSGGLLTFPWWWAVLGVGVFVVWLGLIMLIPMEGWRDD
jgi:hypothetical protein